LALFIPCLLVNYGDNKIELPTQNENVARVVS